MKKLAIAVLALLPLIAIASDSAPTAGTLKHASGPKLEVAVKPTTSDAYQVSMTISDRTTGKVLATPSMTVKPGVWATAEIGEGVAGEASISLAVSITPSGKGAAFFVEFRQASGLIQTETGTLLIRH